MVPPGDVERIELERADPVDDPHDAGSVRWQRPGRRQEVSDAEEAAGDRHGDGPLGGLAAI